MMSPLPPLPPSTPQAPQSNAKRYWGEEKNIDSVYSIYLKKICYSNNNDLLSSSSTKGNGVDRRGSQDSRSSSTASSNDLARFAAQANHESCQKESPRGRKNFFQKYRRRSCSMDKYSFDKFHKGNSATNTPNSSHIVSGSSSSSRKDTSKTMRYESPSKKANKLMSEAISYDDLDGGPAMLSSKGSEYSHRDSRLNASLQKSMNDISGQAQSLQWETRQIRILQAATLDHVLKFILLINSTKDVNSPNADTNSSTGDCALDEERNNVAHIIHVFFCTYRIYTNPYELMLKLMDYSDICRVEQYRFVMHYWMDNYPEDFEFVVESPENCDSGSSQKEQSNNSIGNMSAATQSMNSHNNSINSYDSSLTTRTSATADSETSTSRALNNDNGTIRSSGSRSGTSDNLDRRLSNLSLRTNNDNEKSGVLLVEELLRLCRDEYIRKRATRLNELRAITSGSISSGPESETNRRSKPSQSSKNSAILDLDSRYVAQQLTAIDLENFLQLRPYSLLEGTRSDKRVQCMIKNFNLLSRHVVVTILKSHTPSIVAAHWIAIAMNLRKIKNFNSLKAIIAGLTNESIYRLKQLIWSKLDRTSAANFKVMASIVDDVNNQIVLRQTQLVVEGTAKMSIEDDSFGTIPYLGTFLTDLNMIDARYPTHVPSPKDETSKLKLINFEKCAKQFEILTQVQLLQKNVLASLHALQRRNHFDEQSTLNRLKLEYNQNRHILATKPAIPKPARLFENWFYDNAVASMTDKQCTRGASVNELAPLIENIQRAVFFSSPVLLGEIVSKMGAKMTPKLIEIVKPSLIRHAESFRPLFMERFAQLHKLLSIPTSVPKNVAHVGGERSYVLLGSLAKLESALMKWTMNELATRFKFIPVVVPNIIHDHIIEKCGFPTKSRRSQVYKISGTNETSILDELDSAQLATYENKSHPCIAGTSEFALASIHIGDSIPYEELPKRYCAMSRCYRAETSSTSSEWGLYRVHYFNKIEMFAFTMPNRSEEMHEEFLTIQKDLFKQLNLHFQVLDMPEHDLGLSAKKKYDIEAWMSGRQRFGEISSTSNCEDYQSSRLNIKYSRMTESDNQLQVNTGFVHTINGTACSSIRTMIALCEQHQTEEGKVILPDVLVPYMDGIKSLPAEEDTTLLKEVDFYPEQRK